MIAARSRQRNLRRASEPLRTDERAIKAGLTAAVTTIGTLIAHVAGGADLPGPAAIIAALGLTALIAFPLSGRAVSPLRLAGIVAASQALFHLLFLVGTPTEAAQLVAMTQPGHESHVGHATMLVDGGPLLASHAMHLTWQMIAAHAIAAAGLLVVLHSGERIVQNVIDAARDAWRGLRTLVTVIAVALREPTPPTRIAWPSTPARPTDVILAWTGSRRGPPTATTATH